MIYKNPFNPYQIDFKFIKDEMRNRYYYYGIYHVPGIAPLRCWEEYDDSDWEKPHNMNALQEWELKKRLTNALEESYNKIV